MMKYLILLAALLLPMAAMAQTVPSIPATGPNNTAGQPTISRTDLQNAFGNKQDYPALSFLVNPNPSGEAQAYTSGNTASILAGDSQYSLSSLWPLLDGGTQHDGIAGITRSVPTTTVTQINGLGGYCDNANPNNMTTGVGVCVAVGAFGVNRVDGAQSWMFDGILTDVGTGGGLGRIMQSELDYKPAFVNTQVNGMLSVIDSAVQPTVADAFTAGSTYNGTTKLARWQNGFRTYPNQAKTAFLADLSQPAGTHSANSQPISWQATDASGAAHQLSLIAEGAATALVLVREDSGPTGLVIGNGGLGMALAPGIGPAFAVTQNLTGTVATQNFGNNFYIASDNLNMGSGFSIGWNFSQLFGGSAAQGARVGLNVSVALTAPTSSSNTNRNYVGLQGGVVGSSGDGGTNLTTGAKGALFGFSSYFRCFGTNLNECTGGEINSFQEAGSSVRYKNIWSLVGGGTEDAVQGSTYDTMLALSDQPGSVGHQSAILIGPMNGQQPITASGAILQTVGTATITGGIDLTSYTFTGNAFASPGFKVTGTGATTAPTMTLVQAVQPATPAAGTFIIYQDSTSHALKAIGPSGTVTTIASP